MKSGDKKMLRIFFATGPGDVIRTYRYWNKGQDDPFQISRTYAAQFYDVCRKVNTKACVISQHNRKDCLMNGTFEIRHEPIPFKKPKNAFLYHLRKAYYGLFLVISAVRFKADIAVIKMVENIRVIF